MAKYHINEAGEAGACSATKEKCPFGGEANHYATKKDAQKAFELSMAAKTVAPTKRLSSKEAIERAEQARSLRGFTALANGDFAGVRYKPTAQEIVTHEKLQELSKNAPLGNMFERASSLKKNFHEFLDENEDERGRFVDPEELDRDTYLYMVSPATSEAVLTVEVALEEDGWTMRVYDEDIDRNRRVFSKLLGYDMSTASGAAKAVKELKDAGFQLEEAEAIDELQDAILAGQKRALTYGNKFALEQKTLL